MYLVIALRDVKEGTSGGDTVIPPWAMVAIAVVIYAVTMLVIGIACHRYGCLGSRPQIRHEDNRQSSQRHSVGRKNSATSSASPSRRVSQVAETIGNAVRRSFVVDGAPPSRRASQMTERAPRQGYIPASQPPSRRVSQLTDHSANPSRRKERPPLVGLTSSETVNVAMLRPPPPAYTPPTPHYRASLIRDNEKRSSSGSNGHGVTREFQNPNASA